LSGDISGDISAALGMIPGTFLAAGADGRPVATAFGLGGGDNVQTINGSTALGSPLPRDGLRQSVRLSTYDPRDGRFAGLQIVSLLPAGSALETSSLRITASPTALQVGSPAAGRLQEPERDLLVSGTRFGSLFNDRAFHASSVQLRQRISTALPLDGPGAERVAGLGVDPGLIENVLDSARARGLPVSAATAPLPREVLEGSALTRLDFTDAATALGNPTGDVLYLLASAGGRRSAGTVSPFATRSAGVRRWSRDASLTAAWSPFVSFALVDVRSRVLHARDGTDPASALPAARVLLAPTTDASAPLIVSTVGGSETGASRGARTSWESFVDVTWMSRDRAHRIAALGLVDLQWTSNQVQDLTAGSYSYRSVPSWQANIPSTFARTLSNLGLQTRGTHAVLAIGDVFTVAGSARDAMDTDGPGVVFQTGLRAEFDDLVLHVREDSALTRVLTGPPRTRVTRTAVLPMAAFSWRHGEYVESSGMASSRATRSQLDAGVRWYRASLAAVGGNGLPGGAALGQSGASVGCVGSSVPVPDWSAYASGIAVAPSACAVGLPLQQLQVPRGAVIGSTFDAPMSVRSELTWRWFFTPAIQGDLGVVATRNAMLGETSDRNFDGVPKFALSEERERPVFVASPGIDAASGDVLPAGSRMRPGFGALTSFDATGRSRLMQWTVGVTLGTPRTVLRTLAPPATFAATARFAYTRTEGTQWGSGFARSTSGDPRAVDHAPVDLPRHILAATLDLRVSGWFTLGLGARLQSGMPFTPLVDRDINGDGIANDRAFVFGDGASTALRSSAEWRDLRRRLPAGLRGCLERQVGRIASPGSCRGPWSGTMGVVALSLDPYRLGFGQRGSITLYVQNAMAGLDRAINGGSAHGWGQLPSVDPTLLRVTGFDPVAQQFRYAINPDFGVNRRLANAFQPVAGLSVDLRLDVGRNLESQAIEGLIRRAVQGRVRTPEEIGTLLLMQAEARDADQTPRVLSDSIALELTTSQVLALDSLATRRRNERSAIYRDLGGFLAPRLSELGTPEVRQRWHDAIVASARSAARQAEAIRVVLTDAQWAEIRRRRLAPAWQLTLSDVERTARAPQLLPR
jgi:hypothetical protein